MRFGHFEVVSELGRGGMGVVYKARDLSLDRHVALKVLGQQVAGEADLIERFKREAKSAASLNHPNITQIYFFGEEAGQFYFVMEFVDGESLSARIRREKKLEPEIAARILHQAASGLAIAHEAGIIHRDIKPGNIMIDRRGVVKIADFGIAHVHDADKKLTATGQFLGTPGYLSPEVCLGKPMDHRSDIFSLGIVYFEMLSGQTPFRSDSPLEMLRQVVEAPMPDIRELEAGVDVDTHVILSKMIDKQPENRYQSCDALVADLEVYLREQPDLPLSTIAGQGPREAPPAPPPDEPAPTVGSAETEVITPPIPDDRLDQPTERVTAPPPPPPPAPATEAEAPRPWSRTPEPPPAGQVEPGGAPNRTKRSPLVPILAVLALLALAVAATWFWLNREKDGSGVETSIAGPSHEDSEPRQRGLPAPPQETDDPTTTGVDQTEPDISSATLETEKASTDHSETSETNGVTTTESAVEPEKPTHSVGKKAPTPNNGGGVPAVGKGRGSRPSVPDDPAPVMDTAPAVVPENPTLYVVVNGEAAFADAFRGHLEELLRDERFEILDRDLYPMPARLGDSPALLDVGDYTLANGGDVVVYATVTKLGERNLNYMNRSSLAITVSVKVLGYFPAAREKLGDSRVAEVTYTTINLTKKAEEAALAVVDGLAEGIRGH